MPKPPDAVELFVRAALVIDPGYQQAADDQVGERGGDLGARFEVGLHVLLHGEGDVGVAGALGQRLPVGFRVAARCIYVFDRLVLPALSLQQIQNAARGQLSLDGLTRQLIRQSLCYRFTVVGDAVAARAVEREIQREGLASGPPLLNPLPRSSTANSS